MDALESAIEDAKRHFGKDRTERTQQRAAPLLPSTQQAGNLGETPPLVSLPQSNAKYMFATVKVNLENEVLHKVSSRQLANWLKEVISVESPIHWLEAARRIASAAGIQRIGSRIQDAFQDACRYGHDHKMFKKRNDFLWAYQSASVQVRDRSNLPSQQKKIELVAPEEIRAAIEQAVKESYGITPDNIAVAACRRLGFARVTEEMRQWVEEQRDKLIGEGSLKLRGETLVLSQDATVL